MLKIILISVFPVFLWRLGVSKWTVLFLWVLRILAGAWASFFCYYFFPFGAWDAYYSLCMGYILIQLVLHTAFAHHLCIRLINNGKAHMSFSASHMWTGYFLLIGATYGLGYSIIVRVMDLD